MEKKRTQNESDYLPKRGNPLHETVYYKLGGVRHGMDWDIPDEDSDMNRTVLEPMVVSKFLASLSETDRQILTLRMDGITLEKIAEKLGYKTHSAVHRRIRKIGLAYEKFTGEDFGFSQKKII